MTFRIGATIWTVCGAGWTVLAYVYQDWLCAAVALGCVAVAGMFHIIGESLGEK